MDRYNPTDTTALDRMERDRKVRARQADLVLTGDIRRVMAIREGRRFVHALLQDAHVWQTCFDQNALQMARMEGERNVGLKLLALLQTACPERILEMLKEEQSNERSDSRSNDN